ncbi:cell division protein SepF [Neomicrococcus aestuarii]|uniref:Cell division protein SepF n=1 Tax=Neomicrococcus aestuarii TaxID=556325 RepID=A0A1L2ZKL3_9MICC|nr:cell division protein SepF [Neomicrococcus aestuarii]APF39737.1 cell division protein SepF [Neomicrococcus aestuarii]MBB5513761.1 cell division inhibitor SepF [Neomicrococcus aestuarii]
MSGALRKTMIYLGLADSEDQDYNDKIEHEARPESRRVAVDERDDDRDDARAQVAPVRRDDDVVRPLREEAAPRPATVSRVEEYRAPVTPIKRASSSREEEFSVRQITTVHPRSYNDAKLIGEAFREGIPVIMNVTDMGESDAKRLVDFSAGLVFALHGTIDRITNKVFLLSPATVEVIGEDKKAAEGQTTFFNQS